VLAAYRFQVTPEALDAITQQLQLFLFLRDAGGTGGVRSATRRGGQQEGDEE